MKMAKKQRLLFLLGRHFGSGDIYTMVFLVFTSSGELAWTCGQLLLFSSIGVYLLSDDAFGLC